MLGRRPDGRSEWISAPPTALQWYDNMMNGNKAMKIFMQKLQRQELQYLLVPQSII